MNQYRLGNWALWALIALIVGYAVWNEQRMLKHERNLYARIVGISNEARIVANDAGIIIDATPAAAAMFGYRLEELIGSPVTILMPEDYKERHLSQYREAFIRHEDRGALTVEAEVPTKSGNFLPVYITIRVAEIDGKRLALALFTTRP